MSHDITINGKQFSAHTQGIVELPIPNFYTSQTPLGLAVHVINGKHAGPRLFISAAIHGDELHGVEIIRRIMRHEAMQQLVGTVVAVPIVNIFGIIQRSRYLPDHRDLNRSFPGSSHGSLASRLAHIFMQEIVSKCTHGIDIHTGAHHRVNLPQIRANIDDPETKRLACAFGAPVVIKSTLRDGSLRQAARELGIPTLLYESGEALRFDEAGICLGVEGILSVMRALNMLPTNNIPTKIIEPFIARSSHWERAQQSGIMRNVAALGLKVESGTELGIIANPTDLFSNTDCPVRCDREGLIIGRTNLPLVNEGDAIFHIAHLEEAESNQFNNASSQTMEIPSIAEPPATG
ncbi:MAG: succinylglutamate desuccinylase/aspartoacylase family protein [Gammaproteobacteria bacterium]|nr:succinylglutamate desuccinylase/aspartoacylase family protein [Gammaproteobacteria bacterium]